ncbi:MAG: hypothetical protein M3O36_01165 [Myxococcota bacterium]|nr:hypothetical protein [Myxococcota bacterium]
MTLALLPRSASAHTLGLSLTEFDVMADGRSTRVSRSPAPSPWVPFAVDQDHDGVVTESEVGAARGALEAFLLRAWGARFAALQAGAAVFVPSALRWESMRAHDA